MKYRNVKLMPSSVFKPNYVRGEDALVTQHSETIINDSWILLFNSFMFSKKIYYLKTLIKLIQIPITNIYCSKQTR